MTCPLSRREIIVKRLKSLAKTSALSSAYLCSFRPKVSDVHPKLSDVHPKVSDVRPKPSDKQQKPSDEDFAVAFARLFNLLII